jgi:hypothetical protein
MSLRDTIDDTSWITYVSPIVRRVDLSSGNNPGTTSSSDRERCPKPRAIQDAPLTIIEEILPELQAAGSVDAGGIDGFAVMDDWNLEEDKLSPDLFDSIPGMDANFWDGLGT